MNMNNYVKPTIELEIVETEDIMAASNVISAIAEAFDLSGDSGDSQDL